MIPPIASAHLRARDREKPVVAVATKQENLKLIYDGGVVQLGLAPTPRWVSISGVGSASRTSADE